MTLREKIARSIGLAAGHASWDALPNTPADFKDGETTCCKDDYRQYADAVLALLSDPANISDEMVEAFDRLAFEEAQPPGKSYANKIRRAIAAAFRTGRAVERADAAEAVMITNPDWSLVADAMKKVTGAERWIMDYAEKAGLPLVFATVRASGQGGLYLSVQASGRVFMGFNNRRTVTVAGGTSWEKLKAKIDEAATAWKEKKK